MKTTTTILKKGSQGAEVADLQYLLLFRGGIDPATLGTIDGNFGPKTEASVKKFQKSQGLTPDGIVGERTWGAITDVREWPTFYLGGFLRQGEVNDATKRLQQGLASKGYYQGKIDGVFGPKTYTAVVKFQLSQSPRKTNTQGVVGPLTFVEASEVVMGC